MEYVAASIIGYLFGSIPFGLLLSKAAGLGDIRAIGSGNIGATNVLRTGRKDLALATLLLDSGKGVAAVLTAASAGWSPEIAGAAALLGHCYPAWLKFTGGKGVATYLGVLFAFHPPAGCFAVVIWLATALTSKFSSLAALTASAAAPLILYVMGKPSFAFAAILMTGVSYLRHKENMKRLLSGSEPRIGRKSEGDDAKA